MDGDEGLKKQRENVIVRERTRGQKVKKGKRGSKRKRKRKEQRKDQRERRRSRGQWQTCGRRENEKGKREGGCEEDEEEEKEKWEKEERRSRMREGKGFY